MELAQAGVEYVYYTVFSDVDLFAQPFVAFTRCGYETDSSTVWHQAGWHTEPGQSRTMRVLIAGPIANPLPEDAISLNKGKWLSWIKFSENPETVIRPAPDTITVK